MYKCRVDGCEREFEKVGPRNLHERACKMKAYDNMTKEKKVEVNEWDLQECEHAWRLLNANMRNEFSAIQNGYGKVCNKCLTLQ